MIRGLVGVIPSHATEVGRFYLLSDYQGGHWLFQCVQTREPLDDGFRRAALFLARNGNPDIGVETLPDRSPVVALDDVHVRIDPTSVAGDASTTTIRLGNFVLDGDAPVLCARSGRHGWVNVNLSTGQIVDVPGHGWLGFKRWSLVMDDEAGDELTIVRFDADEARSG